jgi:antitoxin ParD1/3/4
MVIPFPDEPLLEFLHFSPNGASGCVRLCEAAEMMRMRSPPEKARKGGLRFEAYLPSSLAEWALDLVERGVFTDPSEAVFVILGEHKDLEPHADLREEILRRTLQAAMDDPRPRLTVDEVNERIGKLMSKPPAEPAIWRQREAR